MCVLFSYQLHAILWPLGIITANGNWQSSQTCGRCYSCWLGMLLSALLIVLFFKLNDCLKFNRGTGRTAWTIIICKNVKMFTYLSISPHSIGLVIIVDIFWNFSSLCLRGPYVIVMSVWRKILICEKTNLINSWCLINNQGLICWIELQINSEHCNLNLNGNDT